MLLLSSTIDQEVDQLAALFKATKTKKNKIGELVRNLIKSTEFVCVLLFMYILALNGICQIFYVHVVTWGARMYTNSNTHTNSVDSTKSALSIFASRNNAPPTQN